MERYKSLGMLIGVAVLLWLLTPSRSPYVATDANVVEIVFMGPGGPIAGAMDDVVRAFERESLEAHRRDPSKPIYRVVSGQSGARDQVADPTRFLISVAGGMPPDVIFFDRFAVAEWAARGAFTPLDTYIEADLAAGHPDAIRPERFYKTVWDEANYQGRPYGIPNSVDDRALMYNRDLFRRAGIVDEHGEPTPPKNWQELRDYAKRLTEYDAAGNVKVLGFAPNFGNSWLYMFGWMNGGEFMSADGKTVTLNDPRIVEALQFMVDIYNDAGGYKQVMGFQAGFQGGALDPFITGKVAMKIDGAWQMPFMAQFGRDLDFGVAPPPVSQAMIDAGTPTVTWNGGWSYAIPSVARNKDAAWEFIRFVMSDRAWEMRLEAERDAVEAQGRLYIPPQIPLQDLNDYYLDKYVTHNPIIPERIKNGCRVFADLLPYARFRPITPVGQLLWNWHVSSMEDACYGRKTPQQALDYGTQVVQRALDKILYPPPGKPITNWNFFFVGYGLLILALMAGAYAWDTSVKFRRGLSHLLRRRARVDVGDVVEGARGGYFRRQWWAGYLFALPWIIGFIVFGGGPLLYSILMSFCDYDVLQPARWIGLENYRRLFDPVNGDELIPIAFANTLYMVIGVPLGMIASLALALLLNMNIRGISVWRTIFYLPAIVPGVAAYILWIWIFNPQGGVLNAALGPLFRLFGMDAPNWLGDAVWSKPALIVMGLWGAGGGMLIWLAGLKGISEQYYEAAAIDGAGEWQQFRHITLPMLSPYIFFNLIMGLIGVFQIFDAAFVMTQGGPANSTLFYVYHLFNNAFRYGQMGYASAMAWVLFVIILALTIAQLKLAKRWVHYEE